MKTTIKEKVYINRQSKEQACNFKIYSNTSSIKKAQRNNSPDNVLAKLLSYNDVIMNWLDKDDANVQLFFEDPVSAFKKATNAPDELLEACKDIKTDYIDLLLSDAEDNANENEFVLRSTEDVNSTFIDYSQGWDFVSAITQGNANKLLNHFFKNEAIIFHKTASFSIIGVKFNVSIEGKFGTPQISGGTGSNISIEIPVLSASIIINDTEISVKDGILSFTTVLTSVESEFKPEDGGITYDYFINFTDNRFISEVTLKNFGISGETLYLVQGVIVNVMNEVFGGKEYKLFSVNLNGIDDKYPYMIPKYIRYAFIECDGNHDNNTIGVLVQTTGEKSSFIQLDVRTIPSNCDAAVILSNRLAIDGLLRNMAKNEIGIEDDNIIIEEKEGMPRVLIAKETFNYKEKVKGYTAQITNLRLWFADDLLYMELGINVEPSKGLHIKYSVKASYDHKIETTTDKDGKKIQTIVFDKKDYKEDKEVSADWWVWLLGVLARGIGAIIVGIVLGIIKAVSPSLKSSVFKDALVKVNWNYIDIASIQHLNTSGHIQIGAKVTLLSE